MGFHYTWHDAINGACKVLLRFIGCHKYEGKSVMIDIDDLLDQIKTFVDEKGYTWEDFGIIWGDEHEE